MKALFLTAALLASTVSFAPKANAAIEYQKYSCSVTHAPNRPMPIPDAPSYGLECYIRMGGVSGHGLNCDLLVKSLFPAGRESKIALETKSYEGDKALLATADGETKVAVDLKKEIAKIRIGNSMQAECEVERQ